MPQTNLSIDIRLNLEGDWPRSAYLLHCQQQSIEFTDEGYLQWRAVGERLTGQPCFETSVKRAADALASLGKTFAMIGPHMQALVEMTHDEESQSRSRCHADADRQGATRPASQ